ncbi:hypothetical protein BVI434_1410021 [Burkholderia vietnamiensis]|nr:hypothetical protein BVI434_1410021 [Burkholderia vietnamiensis]
MRYRYTASRLPYVDCRRAPQPP